MVWLAVSKESEEYIFQEKPIKGKYWWKYNQECVQLPKGTIKKLIGKELSWNDEPVELTESSE